VSDHVDPGQRDWQVQRATGIAANQIGTRDLSEASGRLVSLAAELGESVHDTALMVVEGRLRLARPGRAARLASEDEHQFALEFDGVTFTARCVCGWRSARLSRAGLGGSVFDVHVEAGRAST
jgi:hypothetical protein